ncbi:MAG: hypothetical protein HY226_03985 [Candidatus Vogelbacteria bacterium]|nr:hypothetical protein [Candidatus Vogelbacteria bacterium]
MSDKNAQAAAWGVIMLCAIFFALGSYGWLMVYQLGKKKAAEYAPAEWVQLVFGSVLMLSSFAFFARGLYLICPALF